MSTITAHPDGDGVHIDVRLVIAPSGGRFRTVGPDPSTGTRAATATPGAAVAVAGDRIDAGALIGHVEQSGTHQPVRSFCAGTVVEVLARPGDQVRAGQPLAWVRPVRR